MIQGKLDFPKVTIIIPVYNGQRFIGRCIEHLQELNYPKDRLEVIIVDDGSTDRTCNIIRSYNLPYIITITTSNKGPSNARNEGIKRASGSIIFFMDSDCLAHKDVILNHVLAHAYYAWKDPDVKMIGGSITGINENLWALCDDLCSWYRYSPVLSSKHVGFHPTANLSVKREVFDDVMFDNEMRHAEDFVFCVQACRKGHKIVFDPKPRMFHINRTSLKSYMRHAKYWSSGHEQLLEKGIIECAYKNTFLGMWPYFIISLGYMLAEVLSENLKIKRFSVILFFPLIFINRFYHIYYMIKHQWDYSMKKGKRQLEA
ncbi:MAG: glycosyltransferase [Clostridiaceae bacterium]|jgi:glycosyltransferase involved in cell wall biosynthesis|nr:glycosyltransferase [Clostridiaceae bacterium]